MVSGDAKLSCSFSMAIDVSIAAVSLRVAGLLGAVNVAFLRCQYPCLSCAVLASTLRINLLFLSKKNIVKSCSVMSDCETFNA